MHLACRPFSSHKILRMCRSTIDISAALSMIGAVVKWQEKLRSAIVLTIKAVLKR